MISKFKESVGYISASVARFSEPDSLAFQYVTQIFPVFSGTKKFEYTWD